MGGALTKGNLILKLDNRVMVPVPQTQMVSIPDRTRNPIGIPSVDSVGSKACAPGSLLSSIQVSASTKRTYERSADPNSVKLASRWCPKQTAVTNRAGKIVVPRTISNMFSSFNSDKIRVTLT